MEETTFTIEVNPFTLKLIATGILSLSTRIENLTDEQSKRLYILGNGLLDFAPEEDESEDGVIKMAVYKVSGG